MTTRIVPNEPTKEMSKTPRTYAHCQQIIDDALGLEYAATELQYWAEKLEEELAAAQADAERYRWLRARPVEDCTTPRIEVNAWTCNVNDDGGSDSVNDGSVLAGDALDAAIDAAMRECGK